MTDSTPTQLAAPKAPSHLACHVRDREGAEGSWTLIGSAWPHADGHGFNIQLGTMPLDGRIALRLVKKSN